MEEGINYVGKKDVLASIFKAEEICALNILFSDNDGCETEILPYRMLQHLDFTKVEFLVLFFYSVFASKSLNVNTDADLKMLGVCILMNVILPLRNKKKGKGYKIRKGWFSLVAWDFSFVFGTG